MTRKTQYTAKITTNEPKKFIKQFKDFFKTWTIKEEHLPVGDILLGSGLCIERKTTNDFDGSILDGRLERQLYHMSHNFDLSVVAVVGYIAPSKWDKYSIKGRESRIIARMATIAMSYPNVRVIKVDNNKQLFQLIAKLYSKYEMKNGVVKPKIVLKNKESKEEVAATLLTALPGIGAKRANKILSGNSLKSITHMELPDLLEIMPKKAAQMLFSLFHEAKK